jgi:hypothetical protein
VAVSVVALALLGVPQNLKRLGRFLEPIFGGLVAGIAVGVVGGGQFAVGLFEFVLRRPLRHAQHFVIVALRGHHDSNFLFAT